MSYYVFVDNSNVWIEGKYVSAVKKGLAEDITVAHENRIEDSTWTIDFGRLLYHVVETNITDVSEAIMVGSKPTDKDSLWSSMQKCGFRVINRARNAANKEKQIDTGIVTEICRYLYKFANPGDTFVLVMGDSDYVPVMKEIRDAGVNANVAFWNHASSELKSAATKFISLTDLIDNITY